MCQAILIILVILCVQFQALRLFGFFLLVVFLVMALSIWWVLPPAIGFTLAYYFRKWGWA